MNTQSFNLEKTVNGVEPGDKDGEFMFKVLNVCATVTDLKQYLGIFRIFLTNCLSVSYIICTFT